MTVMSHLLSVETRKPVIAVWFSCGAASAVALKLTIEKYGQTHEIRVMNNPIKEEHPDNRRFLSDVANWLRVDIELVVSSAFPSSSSVDVWNQKKAMSFPKGAPCTRILKRHARQEWEKKNHHDFLVMGFTADERERSAMFQLTERSNLLPILIDANLSKQDCFDILTNAGIALPRVYHEGFPNANCLGCPKATSPTYWNHLRLAYPEVFQARAEQSRRLGVRLVRVKGRRIFLDELDPQARGRKMKTLKSPECGLFCEERVRESY